MRKIVKISWIVLRSILLFILLLGTTTVVVEHVEKDVLVSNFKKKAVYQEELSTSTIKYYRVESEEESITFSPFGNDCYPGKPGDILCSVQQTTIFPIVNEVVSFYAGGHAGYVSGEFQDYETYISDTEIIETSMTSGHNKASYFSKRDWMSSEYFTEVIGLRVSMTEEELQEVNSVVTSYLDDPYNSSFIFNTVNSSYCTDLIEKAYKYIGKNLNPDGFTVSIYDLIVAKDTYISYYHYYDSDGVKHIYYLG